VTAAGAKRASQPLGSAKDAGGGPPAGLLLLLLAALGTFAATAVFVRRSRMREAVDDQQ
jgi:hypothetical protein